LPDTLRASAVTPPPKNPLDLACTAPPPNGYFARLLLGK
jgi:hypothetical protein